MCPSALSTYRTRYFLSLVAQPHKLDDDTVSANNNSCDSGASLRVDFQDLIALCSVWNCGVWVCVRGSVLCVDKPLNTYERNYMAHKK